MRIAKIGCARTACVGCTEGVWEEGAGAVLCCSVLCGLGRRALGMTRRSVSSASPTHACALLLGGRRTVVPTYHLVDPFASPSSVDPCIRLRGLCSATVVC